MKRTQLFCMFLWLTGGLVAAHAADADRVGDRDIDQWKVLRAIEWDTLAVKSNYLVIPHPEDGAKTTKIYFGTIKCDVEYLGPYTSLQGKQARTSVWVFCYPLPNGSRPQAKQAYANRLRAVFPTGPTFHHLPHIERGEESTK